MYQMINGLEETHYLSDWSSAAASAALMQILH